MKIMRHGAAWWLALAISAGSASLAFADLDQGMGFFRSGKYAEAAAEFQAMVDHAPNYDFGYYMLGLSFFKMNKYDQAIENIKKAIELNGDKFEYHHAEASVYRAKGENRQALAILNDAEGLVDGSTKYAFYSLRGFVNADLDKWGEAIEDLEKARTAKASSPVLEYLGKAYFKLGYYDKAAPVLREALKLNPNDPNTYLFMSESLVNLAKENGDEAKKKTLFTEALQLATKYRTMRPDDYYASNLVGKAALGARAFKEAEQAFGKVLSIKPDYCYAMVNLAKCYIAQERWPDAERQARAATKCAPRLVAGYESLGYALQKQKKLEDALASYQEAYKIKPTGSLKQLIDIVQKNIAIRAENQEIAQQEQEMEAAAKKAEQEYQEELRKREEWEKKQDD
jgi:tetratricopeptide (TPR) repeat protein